MGAVRHASTWSAERGTEDACGGEAEAILKGKV